MKRLIVSGRFLAYDDGEPFFYLGDTAWELIHKSSREEVRYYMEERKRQDFTVIQTVALAEMEGVTVKNCYGRLPLKFTGGLPDPTLPDTDGEYSYWDHVDFVLKTAEENGLYVCLLPTWGDKYNLLDWGAGPLIFDPDNAYAYGKWIGNRYKDYTNVIWCLGGDRPLETENHRRIIDAMARGIREEDGTHLITFHPPGSFDSTDFVNDADYIDFHAAQTGHHIDKCYSSDLVMRKMAAASDKPFLDMESRYESHPACFDATSGYYWDQDDVRQNSYWNVLAGACGQTYGNHCIWSMNTDANSDYYPYKWQEALRQPAAEQMRYLKRLRLERDYFSLSYAPEILKNNYPGMGHLVAAKGNGYAYIYSPLGLPVTFGLDSFADNSDFVRAIWFDPRSGEETVFDIFPNFGDMVAVPLTCGKGCDWVLILESARRKY